MTASEKIFQKALNAFNQRDLAEAERLFRKVLRSQPNHVATLNLLTVVLMGTGRFAEAEPVSAKASSLSPGSDAACYNLGLILKRLNKPTEALQQFNKALNLNSAVPETWNNRGTVFNDLKRYTDALVDFDRAISLKPSYSEAYANKGKSLAGLKRHADAVTAYGEALSLKPDLAEAWLGSGIALAELKRFDEAFAAYDRALALKPDLSEAWFGRGQALSNIKHFDEALASYDEALAVNPDLIEAWLGRGTVLAELKRCDEAVAAYDKALALKSDLAEAWVGHGNVFTGLRRFDEAFAAYEKARALQPDLAEAWLGRGNAFTGLRRFEEAFDAYDKALTLKPDLAEAWFGRGQVLTELRRSGEALSCYDKALALKPDLAEGWFGRGRVFTELRRLGEALSCYDKALALKSDLAEAWLGRGTVLDQLKRFGEALAAFDQALNLKPDLTYAEGARLSAKISLCDWDNIEVEIPHFLSATTNENVIADPFTLLAIGTSSVNQLQVTKNFVADQGLFPTLWRGQIYSHDRIRIGYFSADFRRHPVAQLAVGLFEQHDKSRFEITAISFGPDDGSDLRVKIKSAAENFIDIGDMPNRAVAQFIRDREIDILVDLMGFTAYNRLNVISERVAPVQVNFLGYPGTMGADFMDYIIADRTVIPKEHLPFYSERVVWLPDTYLPNAYRSNQDEGDTAPDVRHISQPVPTRAEYNLPEAAFVFCCFNGNYKFSPLVFDVWMRLLRAVPHSVLWLPKPNPTAEANLGKEAERRGVSSGRLIFAPRAPELSDHMTRLGQADLFLDTLPYNAHTTASDALWAGVPVLTCAGETFAGRVAASLLRAIGLDDLVTTSLEDYETLALKLARDPSFLQTVKERLLRNRERYPLFDTARFTRHIEAAYVTMWERYQRDEKPEAFAVAPID